MSVNDCTGGGSSDGRGRFVACGSVGELPIAKTSDGSLTEKAGVLRYANFFRFKHIPIEGFDPGSE